MLAPLLAAPWVTLLSTPRENPAFVGQSLMLKQLAMLAAAPFRSRAYNPVISCPASLVTLVVNPLLSPLTRIPLVSPFPPFLPPVWSQSPALTIMLRSEGRVPSEVLPMLLVPLLKTVWSSPLLGEGLSLFPGATPLTRTLFGRMPVLTWTTLPVLRLPAVLLSMPGTLEASLLILCPALCILTTHLLMRIDAKTLLCRTCLETMTVLLKPQFP